MTNRIQTLLSRGKELSWPDAIADSAPFYSFSVTGGNEVKAQLTARPVGQVTAAIQALDLETVKIRVMDPVRGEGWTREYADSIEVAYKTYLTMLAKYPDDAEDILLSEDVDEFWHTHILQTIKYTEDCEAVFGKYLHHTPHIGEVTQEDVEKRIALAEKTRRLYEREFGSEENSTAAWAGVAVKVENAAMSSAAIRTESAAMSSAAIRAGNAAMSSAAIRAGNAAMSSAAIRADNAAMSSAAIRAGNAAMSSAAIRAGNAAMSSAAIRAGNAAMSSAAIRAGNAAMSSAAIRAGNAAMSSAAIRADNAAMSSAAIRVTESAQVVSRAPEARTNP